MTKRWRGTLTVMASLFGATGCTAIAGLKDLPPAAAASGMGDSGTSGPADTGASGPGEGGTIPSGGGDFSQPVGTVNGSQVTVVTGVATQIDEARAHVVVVFMGSSALVTCAAAQQAGSAYGSLDVADSTSLELYVASASGKVGGGSFPIGGGVVAEVTVLDSTCNPTVIDATAGSITFSDVSDTISGSYNLKFARSGSLAGTFSIPSCALPTPDGDAGVVCAHQ